MWTRAEKQMVRVPMINTRAPRTTGAANMTGRRETSDGPRLRACLSIGPVQTGSYGMRERFLMGLVGGLLCL